MIFEFLTNILSADATPSNGSFGSTALQIIIPAVVSVIIVVLTNKAANKNKKIDNRTDIYKVELEQLNRQRETLTADNERLRDDLKEELEDCRKLRAELEDKMSSQTSEMEGMKRKINTIEAELFAWRNGFKTIDGYVLVKIPIQEESQPPLGPIEKNEEPK